MIAPKVAKPSKADERDAYELATLRDGGVCVFRAWDCDTYVARDHRQNRQSGNTVVSNLQLLCLKHHTWKTEHPADALAAGYAVPRWATTAEWPARRYVATKHGTMRLAWVLYDDNGDCREISDRDAWRRMGAD